MNDDLFYNERESEKKEPPSDNPYQNNYQNNPYSPYQNNWDNRNYPPPRQANGVAIASLFAGILSLCCCCCPYITLPCSIAGLIMAFLSKKGEPMSGIAIAGLVTSIIGFIIGALFTAYAVYIYTHPELYAEIMKMYEEILESLEAEPNIIGRHLLR